MIASGQIDRELVLRAFRAMADHLRAADRRGEILLAGGAVMALVYDAQRVTRDVDGLIVEGHRAVLLASDAAADELGMRRGWLNEGVSVYLSVQPDSDQTPIFDHPNLAVYAVSAGHLLALKARAARAQDLEDIELLMAELDLTTAEQVIELVAQFFPHDPMTERSQAVIEDIADRRR